MHLEEQDSPIIQALSCMQQEMRETRKKKTLPQIKEKYHWEVPSRGMCTDAC